MAPEGRGEVLEADLTWTGRSFETGIQVEVSPGGKIAAAGRLSREPDRRLTGQALLPGMVNAHSHAFQRGLRGRGETFPADAGSFWTWREAMYELAGQVDGEGFSRLCLLAFREMRRAGITAVGEFHYLHHAGSGDDYALDERVLAAAAEAGVRLVLLQAYYRTGGIGQPLEGAQRRFHSQDPEAYWRRIDQLASGLDPDLHSLGAVAHSIRAASPGEIAELYAEARRRGLPFHMHVEEQRKEITESVSAYGEPPMTLLLERLEISDAFTAVHATHTRPEDMERFAAAGGNVCLCPLTEANLGDGVADLPGILAAGGHLCLGTDSNARISMLEEMRWLEYVQRLVRERRGVVRDDHGSVAVPLWRAATLGGARALDLPCGAIEAGLWADLVAVDLEAPSLAGWRQETLLTSLILGAGGEAIAATAVGGRWREHG